MNDERDLLRDDGFDAELEALIGPPPDAVVNKITPWRRAMNRVLAGVVLTSFTLNFSMLNYILPFAGILLLLLGFRSLREENRWFRAGWIASMLRTLWVMFPLALNAYPIQEEFYRLPIVTALGWGSILLQFLILVFLWGGMRAVQEKAGIPGGAGAALRLVFWYVVLFVMALENYTGWLGMILLIVAFVRVLKNIYRLSKEPEEAGYAVRAAPVRLGDGALTAALCAVLAAAIACGFLFFQTYPMDWQEFQPSENSAAAEVRQRLMWLGFPKEALDDLTEEDILACRGALRVVCSSSSYAISGRNGNDLRLTHIAVELPGEREAWKIFHHFLWTENPGFVGTESIKVWPLYNYYDGWAAGSGFTGQVLYDRGGRTWAAPYWFLGTQTYTTNSLIWGEDTSTDAFAAFSLPSEGARQRGYVSYGILAATEEECIITAWVDYTHQNSRFQYPARTALQLRLGGYWHGWPFKTVQGVLQFFPWVGVPFS